MTAARLLITIALRSVTAHKVKSLIVGGLLAAGTALLVFGLSVLGSIERALEGSVTSSLSGQFQVYDSEAEDPLELFGGFGGGLADLGEIEDFSKVEQTLMAVDGVSAVVPMGIVNTTVFAPTELDEVLGDMRDAVQRGDLDGARALEPQVRRIAETFQAQQDLRLALTSDPAAVERDKAALAAVVADAFWTPFHPSPATAEEAEGLAPDTAAMLRALDYMDTRVAPLASDGRLLYLRAIGTDLQQFSQSFDRFYVVKGEPVPEGQRGILLSNRTYERVVKNRAARELDDIYTKVTEKGQKIAEDTLLREQVARNARQFPRIVFQLSPADAVALEGELRAYLNDQSSNLDKLVENFLTVDDANLAERYDWFYAHIGPRIRLYDIPVGNTITLRAFTRSGYLKTVNVKVYGTYEFRGLEKSDLASASNLTDLMTFRQLFGKMSDEQKAELEDIRASMGVSDVGRENAEDALFGGSAPIEVEASPDISAAATASTPEPSPEAPEARPGDPDEGYTREELRSGLVLNAAVILKDPKRASEIEPALEAAIKGGGLRVQLLGWLQASGTVGQLIFVMRGILGISFVIIFGVALIIVNNALVMATMDRVPEIGTMRAIGARRSVVVWMFLLETLVLGGIAGGVGAALGVGMVTLLGRSGIPAINDQIVFLFAGPRLYPSWEPAQVVLGIALVLVVAVISTVYPAVLGSRVPPIVAMQGKE